MDDNDIFHLFYHILDTKHLQARSYHYAKKPGLAHIFPRYIFHILFLTRRYIRVYLKNIKCDIFDNNIARTALKVIKFLIKSS